MHCCAMTCIALAAANSGVGVWRRARTRIGGLCRLDPDPLDGKSDIVRASSRQCQIKLATRRQARRRNQQARLAKGMRMRGGFRSIAAARQTEIGQRAVGQSVGRKVRRLARLQWLMREAKRGHCQHKECQQHLTGEDVPAKTAHHDTLRAGAHRRQGALRSLKFRHLTAAQQTIRLQ